jgi:VWFA-related protein
MIYTIAYPLEMNFGRARGVGGGFGQRGGFGGGFGRPGMDPGEAEKAMKVLADQTGGRLFTKPTASRLDDIYQEIQDEVRSQYSISYSPPLAAKRDGKFRKIEVRAVSKDYKVQARKGYYAAAAAK